MTTSKKSIAQIRGEIRGLDYLRHALTGGTTEEFKRQRVAWMLKTRIAEVEALDIPARFVADIEHRVEAIHHARMVIARWHAAQDAPPGPALQLARVREEWERIAGEPLDELIAGEGVIMCRASELACLRLEHEYNSPKARAYKNEVLGWRFRLDTRVD